MNENLNNQNPFESMNKEENGYNEQIQSGNMNYDPNANYSNGMNNGNNMMPNGMNHNGQMNNMQGYDNNGMNMQGYNNGMNNMQGNNMQYNNGMQGNGMNYNMQGNNMNPQMQGMNNPNMGMNNYNNTMDYNNYGMQQENFGMPQQNPGNQVDFTEMTEYKKALRADREVQNLTSEVNIDNPNSIVLFGQGASENISKVSDQLLNSMKAIKAEEASEMLSNLTKLMDKFDVKELDGSEKQGFLSKIMKGMGDSLAKLFQKYDTMGMEVEKIYVLLKRYESEIKEANANLKKLYDANLHFYKLLEKYIVAGEMAIEEVDAYIGQIQGNMTINDEQKQMMTRKLEVAKDMLSQRVYDLQTAENVAIQAAPMIQTIQMSNFNLMRKINSSFIITLPIFKQCLAQAIILKRQEIQAKSIKQLDDKTNELIMRNASATARQSVEIAKMSSGSSIQITTLEKSYETIMKGIEDTRAIQEQNKAERIENSKRLEEIKYKMKKNIPN
ncbi:MAG: toxic anion resistance protein [Clostridium sp.]|uniref:toxic anion resistance protein n=1 Tax=Clostridium sp. TaxID=1506 RepID=UPI003F361741